MTNKNFGFSLELFVSYKYLKICVVIYFFRIILETRDTKY